MNRSFQESLLQWMDEPERDSAESQKDRIAWTKTQVALLADEPVQTLPDMEALCKKKGILIWSIKHYNPQYYKDIIEKTRNDIMQRIIEDIRLEGCSLPQLRKMLKEMNESSKLDKHHWEITCEDLQEYDPQWFQLVFEQRYVTLTDCVEKGSPPRYKKVLDI